MANPKVVVLLRVGDFYEIMGENARTVAEELDLTLTSREVGLPERVPMCGFPYYASDAYIEKIIARHGVLLAEDGQEPKYILSHAEALQAEQAKISEEPEQESQSEIVERDEDEIAELQELFSEEEEEIKDPELIPIDDEPTPFDDEEEEQSDEEADDGFEDEEDFEEESEQEETENKPKPTRKKEEKGIKDRPRKQKPQLSLFDLMEPQEKSEQELLIERSLKYGSGFQHGKYRIFDTVFLINTTKIRRRKHLQTFSNGNTVSAGAAAGEEIMSSTTAKVFVYHIATKTEKRLSRLF